MENQNLYKRQTRNQFEKRHIDVTIHSTNQDISLEMENLNITHDSDKEKKRSHKPH